MSHGVELQWVIWLVFLALWAGYAVGFFMGKSGHPLAARNEFLESEVERLEAELRQEFGKRERLIGTAVKQS